MPQTPSNQPDKAQERHGKPKHLQLDPSQHGYCVYQITQSSDVIAAILSVNKEVTIDSIKYDASTEYWSTNGPPEKQACSLVNTTSDGLEWATPAALPSGYPLEGATETLDCSTTATWVATPSPAEGWYGTNRDGIKVGLSWVGTTITWHISSASLPTSPTYVIDAGEASLSLTYEADAPAPATGQAWYSVSYTVTTVPLSP